MQPTHTTINVLPEITIQVRTNGEWVQAMMERDPSWTYVDKAGHGHFYAEGQYPTLVWVHAECTLHDDCDGMSHWECALCGETISPGMRAGKPQYIAGPPFYEIEVMSGSRLCRYTIDQRIFDALAAKLRNLVVEELQPHLTEMELR